jgi:hypothetical protein
MSDLSAAGDDVVGLVVVQRGADLAPAGLDLGQEAQQRPPVVALREALAAEQPARLQLGVGQQEPVGGHQVDPRVAGAGRQQGLQQPGGGALADGDAAGHRDDVGHLGRRVAQELAAGRPQPPAGLHVEPQQPGQRQVDRRDLVEVDPVAEAGQRLQLRRVERQRAACRERTPRVAVEHRVGRHLGPCRCRHAAHPTAVTDSIVPSGLSGSPARVGQGRPTGDPADVVVPPV